MIDVHKCPNSPFSDNDWSNNGFLLLHFTSLCTYIIFVFEYTIAKLYYTYIDISKTRLWFVLQESVWEIKNFLRWSKYISRNILIIFFFCNFLNTFLETPCICFESDLVRHEISIQDRAKRHDFSYSFPLFSSLLKKEGRRNGEWIVKIMILSHAFLLDLRLIYSEKYSIKKKI